MYDPGIGIFVSTTPLLQGYISTPRILAVSKQRVTSPSRVMLVLQRPSQGGKALSQFTHLLLRSFAGPPGTSPRLKMPSSVLVLVLW